MIARYRTKIETIKSNPINEFISWIIMISYSSIVDSSFIHNRIPNPGCIFICSFFIENVVNMSPCWFKFSTLTPRVPVSVHLPHSPDEESAVLLSEFSGLLSKVFYEVVCFAIDYVTKAEF